MNFLRRLNGMLPWLIVAFLSCAAVLIVLAPAAWLAPRAAQLSGGHVKLIAPRGSVWHGSATLVLAAGEHAQTATLLPGRIEWDTAFWPLFTGRLRLRLRHSDAMPEPVEIVAALSGATLSAGKLAVPASLLAGLGAPFNTLDLTGSVMLDWTPWRVFGQRVFGQLGVTLTDMSSRVSPVKPLGSYRLVCQALGAHATVQLTTLKGPLLLDGKGALRGQTFSFSGTARAEPASRDALLGLLNLIGQRINNDTYSLNFVR